MLIFKKKIIFVKYINLTEFLDKKQDLLGNQNILLNHIQ